MFVGHYGVALAATGAEPKASLAGMFVATQLLDIVFSALLLTGTERVSLDPMGMAPEGSP